MSDQTYALKALDKKRVKLAEADHWDEKGFHFKAKEPKVKASIVSKPGKQKEEPFTDHAWQANEAEHGSTIGMTATAKDLDGKDVRFVVQHLQDGKWVHYATVPGEVKGGVASATLLASHPVLPPTGPMPAPEKITAALPSDLRFTVEKGPAKPQSIAKKKELKHLAPAPPKKKPEEPKLQAHHLPEATVLKALAEGGHEEILKAHFGDSYEDIKAAVKAVAAKASQKKKRRVLILPGVMGSLLGEPKGDSNHVKWLDPTEVIAGHLLSLTYEGAKTAGEAVASLLPTYLPIKLRLQLAGHDCDILHYDWRLKLEDLGAYMAKKILADKAEKITMVVHSMGGLVVRSALKQSAAANAKVEMVVQMGTPNLGAPTLAQAIRGSYPAMHPILLLDPKHTYQDYGKLIASFPGLYALLPPQSASYGLALRDASLWPKAGVQPKSDFLANCGKLQDDLLAPDSRFFLVAGANLETVTNVRKQGDDFLYDYSYAGDGTVPITSAQMPGLTQAWFADGVAHDQLCISPTACDAAAAILDGGTPKLPTTFKAKKDGITKTETDASLLEKAKGTLDKIEGDARHVVEAVHAAVAKVSGATDTLHTSMKKAGSWLKSHF